MQAERHKKTDSENWYQPQPSNNPAAISLTCFMIVRSPTSKDMGRQHSLENDHREVLGKGKMKTISSLLDFQAAKKEKKQFGDVRLKRHRELVINGRQEKDEEKCKKIETLVGHLRNRVQGIMRMSRQQLTQQQRLQTLEREQGESEDEQHQRLVAHSQLSSAKLIALYLSRCIKKSKKLTFQTLHSQASQANASQSEQNYLSANILPICPPSSQQKQAPKGRKLMNVNKFLESK